MPGEAISWRSVKQNCIVHSTMEAEYVAASEAAKEVVWLNKFFIGLDVVPAVEKPITLFCDNSEAVSQCKEPRNHKKGKHIERKYHLIREFIQRKDIVVEKITTTEKPGGPFPRTHTEKVFVTHLESMGIRFYRSDLLCK